MSEQQREQADGGDGGHQPIFLLPGIVSAMVGVLVAVYLVQTFVLNPEWQLNLLRAFSFQPLRIAAGFEDITYAVPLLWTSFTHALLHDGWEHLLVNCAWLAIFATPVARRYGGWKTVVLFFVCAAAGAFAFALTNLSTNAYLLGASGGVSGLTGAAIRFMFQPVLFARDGGTGERVILGRRLISLGGLLRDPRARAFTLIWLGLNAAVPLLPALTGGGTVQIAWQAHIGGFLAGMLLVGLFERRNERVQ